jgi:large subunit ribosomal protein L3
MNIRCMKYLLGKKIEMTQAFREDGTVVPVTLVSAEPCTVAALRQDPQGRSVAILGTGAPKHIAKPQAKEFGEKGAFARTAQVTVPAGETLEAGQVLNVTTFAVGDKIDVVGTSKGRGFQGVVKRHGFAGHPTTHGHKDQVRKSGSIGAGGVQRVFKGMRMAGRMGTDRVTVKNLEVVTIDAEKNIIGVKGAIPGARGSEVTLIATNGNVWQN